MVFANATTVDHESAAVLVQMGFPEAQLDELLDLLAAGDRDQLTSFFQRLVDSETLSPRQGRSLAKAFAVDAGEGLELRTTWLPWLMLRRNASLLQLDETPAGELPALKVTCRRCRRTLCRLRAWSGAEWCMLIVEQAQAKRVAAIGGRWNPDRRGQRSVGSTSRFMCGCGRDVRVTNARMGSEIERAIAFGLRELRL